MAAVWGRTVVENANLIVQIAALRLVLDDGRTEGSCIQTVAERGYRFTASVIRVEHAASPTLAGGAPEDTSAARRLIAILAADVAGYSRLMGEDEEGTLARLKAHRQEAVERGIDPGLERLPIVGHREDRVGEAAADGNEAVAERMTVRWSAGSVTVLKMSARPTLPSPLTSPQKALTFGSKVNVKLNSLARHAARQRGNRSSRATN